jgi:hypothetical protein
LLGINWNWINGYDCATFNQYGVCLSFQARYGAMESLHDGAGVLTAAYRLSPNLRLGGFINATPGFIALPAVMNGASDLMVQAFGDRGRHARTTVGVSELPLDAAVEIEAMIEFE